MRTSDGAAPFVPDTHDLPELGAASLGCRGCPLFEDATQVVFGEGPRDARLMFVGEQPGDVEDRTGHPFVGPAGRLLFDVLDELGVARSDVYVTNAVKHFRFVMRGKRRIHQKPSVSHVQACHPWLVAELASIDPDVVVCLGAAAVRAALGAGRGVTELRGTLTQDAEGRQVVVTAHPSAVLRAPDRESARAALRTDLVVAVEALSGPGTRSGARPA